MSIVDQIVLRAFTDELEKLSSKGGFVKSIAGGAESFAENIAKGTSKVRLKKGAKKTAIETMKRGKKSGYFKFNKKVDPGLGDYGRLAAGNVANFAAKNPKTALGIGAAGAAAVPTAAYLAG